MATTIKAKTQPKVEEKRKPDFIARAKQSPESDCWLTIGAAWSFANKDGEVCYSVRINSMPTNWDSSFVLMPPLPDRE